MLKDLWRVLTGTLSWEYADQLYWDNYRLRGRLSELDQVEQLKRDLGLAQAAIAELKSHLPQDYEAQRKAASDALGNEAIADMRLHPEKYIKK